LPISWPSATVRRSVSRRSVPVDRVPEDEERRASVVLREVIEDRARPLDGPSSYRERDERLGDAVPMARSTLATC
jgi:hypothetical protein